MKTVALVSFGIFLFFLQISCTNPQHNTACCLHSLLAKPTLRTPLSCIEKQMLALGLVDITTIDSSLKIDIKYSTLDNFLKIDFYGDFNKAYLQPEVAGKLACAQAFLHEVHPDYSLIIFDAARPLAFQKMIWDSLKMPACEKGKYACSPKNGSLHNFGAAVDLSITDSTGKLLDMGCSYDFFGPLAYPVQETQLRNQGLLSQTQIDHRKLLRAVMSRAGFFNIQTEWWHFNSCTRVEAMGKYKRIE